jgi:hypothetical protein
MRTVHRQALILHLTTSQFSQEDDHDKWQPSTSLSGEMIPFLSNCAVRTCNDINFTHHSVRHVDRGEFIVQKYAFWCRRHFPGLIVAISHLWTRLLF